jgi:transcriptional regulator with XRE-family HTH domain
MVPVGMERRPAGRKASAEETRAKGAKREATTAQPKKDGARARHDAAPASRGAATPGARRVSAKVKAGISDRDARAPAEGARGTGETGIDLDLKLGETVRRLRGERGLSIQGLARLSGLSPGTIHKVENDAMVPSVTVLMKLARSLECAVGDLLAEDAEGRAREVAVFRADRRPVLTFAEAPVRVHPIVGKLVDRQLEAGVYVVEPGARSSTEAIVHPGEKIYYVLVGAVRFVIDRRPIVLSAGDAVHLKAHLPHRWENAGDARAELLFVLTPPLGSVPAARANSVDDDTARSTK